MRCVSRPDENLPVFVLNLPTDALRRTLVGDELSRIGLKATWVDGVDASDLGAEAWARYDGVRCRAIYGQDMLPQELGCFLGHERVLRKIVEDGHDVALVFEDDVIIDDALPSILDELLRSPSRSWNVIRLASLRGKKMDRAIQHSAPIHHLAEQHALYRLKTHVLGAQGYLITREGARRFLDYSQQIFLPFDHALDRFWENGIHPFVVYPFLVRERDDVVSSIGKRDPGRRYHQGMRSLWRRRFNRWKDSIGKRYYTLRYM